MTPIKIRGKKSQGRRRNFPLSAPAPGSKRLPKSTLTPSKRSRKSTMTSPPATPTLSHLERLPLELLQAIFLQSLNLSLPRASLQLGLALSSPHIKTQLVLTAFTSTAGYNLKHSVALLESLHDYEGIARLQSGILRLKWMTLGFLNRCTRVFVARTLLGECRDRGVKVWENGSPLTERSVDDFVRSVETAEIEEGSSLELRCWQWSISNVDISLRIGTRDGLVRLQTWKHTLKILDQDVLPWEIKLGDWRWRLLFCVDDCWIPEKLLHGPWTDSKLTFLEILARAGARVDWIGSTAGETASKGLHDAIAECNVRAVKALVTIPPRIYDVEKRNNVDKWALREEGDVNNRALLPREEANVYAGVTPRTEHLRRAVLGGCHKDIVRRLLSVPGEVDREDREVVGWGLRKREEGDARGKWLLDALRVDTCYGG